LAKLGQIVPRECGTMSSWPILRDAAEFIIGPRFARTRRRLLGDVVDTAGDHAIDRRSGAHHCRRPLCLDSDQFHNASEMTRCAVLRTRAPQPTTRWLMSLVEPPRRARYPSREGPACVDQCAHESRGDETDFGSVAPDENENCCRNLELALLVVCARP